MSKEFEEVVLQKLNKIEGTLNEHTEELKKVNKVLDTHTVVLNEHTKEFKRVNMVLADHSEQFRGINKELYQIKNKIIRNTDAIEELSLVVRFNTETIEKSNKIYGRKIDMALNAYEQLNSKVKELTQTA